MFDAYKAAESSIKAVLDSEKVDAMIEKLEEQIKEKAKEVYDAIAREIMLSEGKEVAWYGIEIDRVLKYFDMTEQDIRRAISADNDRYFKILQIFIQIRCHIQNLWHQLPYGY